MFFGGRANYRSSMSAPASSELFSTWLTGWSTCRGYEPSDDGSTTSVVHTDRDNETEHFLYEPSTELFLRVAEETKADPTRSLSVVTSRLQELIDAVDPLGMRILDRKQSLMSADMLAQDVEDPRLPDEGYTFQRQRDGECQRVSVQFDGEPAAHGSANVVGEYAVFDRIVTVDEFRRRGLATFVMRALIAGALEEDVTTGLLLTTAEGRALYEFLGWEHLIDVFVIRG